MLLSVVVFLLYSQFVCGTYLLSAYHCTNTSCTDEELRGGLFEEVNCTVNGMHDCHYDQVLNSAMSSICYNQLGDFPDSSVILYAWPSTNQNCSGHSPSKYIIRTGLCERKWNFMKNDTGVTVNIYDNLECDNDTNSLESHEYPFETCITNSHYDATILFKNNV
jgi:hypothetical protein